MGLVPGKAASPQTLYLDLIRRLGIPPQTAWAWVRKVYPNWGAGYYQTGG